MSEKDEALQQLSEIKSVLVDKDSFFPYNYNALIVWGVIGLVMSVVMPYLMKSSVLWGTMFAVVAMSLGFIIEGFLVKQVNEKYDIKDCTNRQRFIAQTYTFLTLFAIALSAVVAKYDLIAVLFSLWLFLCGYGNFAVGYVLNIKLFTTTGLLSITASVLLLIFSYFVDNLGNLNSSFFYTSQVISIILLGVVPILMGIKLKRQFSV